MTRHPIEPEELQAFLDKELPTIRQAEISRHVKDCQECTAMIADLQKVSATLRRWEVEPAPANLKPPVLQVEKSPRHWNWSRLIVGLGASVAAVLLIAAISIPNLLRSRIAAERAAEYSRQMSVNRNLGAGAQSMSAGGSGSAADELPQTLQAPELGAGPANRLIAYQVRMTVEIKEFETAKGKLRQIMDAEGGYITNSDFVETPNQPKRANLVLRVPAVKLATILAQVRELGRVKEEHLNSEEVTEQVVDLEARLNNSRATEQRLIDVLNNRTGKVGDILQVEQEIARTREAIERMEAQRQYLMKRVELATVTLTLTEEFKAELQPAPVGTLRQLWNALVDGWDNFSGSILGIVFFLARYGLTLALWGGLGWLGWRLARPRVRKLMARGGTAV